MNKKTYFLATACLFVAAGQVPAAEYQFDILRRDGDVIDGTTVENLRFLDHSVAFNNRGEVLFLSGNDLFQSTLMTADRVVAKVGQPATGGTISFIHPSTVSLNNRGDMAFTANHTGGVGTRVYLNQQPVLSTGDRLGPDTVSGIRSAGLALNDNGVVATYAVVNGAGAVVTQHGVVVRDGQLIDGRPFKLIGPQNQSFDIAADGTGRVAFFSDPPTGPRPWDVMTQDRVLALAYGPDGIEPNYGTIALNDGGDFAFSASRQGQNGTQGVIVLNGEPVVTDGQTATGQRIFAGSATVELNEQGQLAYFARLDEGFQTTSNALFVDGDLLLRRGDLVDGYTVRNLHPYALGLNDLGQTLSVAILSDGAGGEFDALVIGTPVPEPSSSLVVASVAACVLMRRMRRRMG